MSEFRVSNAQNREDIILSGFFENVKKGFYVDVGANHPDNLSVTKYFYDKGWNGINIEPNKKLYDLILKQRPRDINLNIGAADKSGELVLREYPDGDGLSTFSKEMQDSHKNEKSEYKKYTLHFEDHIVKVKTLSEIFSENRVVTINFMNIDVEGFEIHVIKGNDWKKYRPQVICIESNHIIDDWHKILLGFDYKKIFFDGLNNYYVANECKNILNNFSYVKTMLLDDRAIIPAKINELINSLYATSTQYENKFIRQELVAQNLRQEYENKFIRQELVAQNLRQEIDRLNNYIGDQQRLRSTLKRLLVSIHAILLMRIEKLNKVKRRRLPSLELSDSLSPEARLKALRLYDLKAYHGVERKSPLSYRAVRGAYLGTARLLFRGIIRPFAKAARRALRRG